MTRNRIISMLAVAALAIPSFASAAMRKAEAPAPADGKEKKIVVKLDTADEQSGEIPVQVIGDADVLVRSIVMDGADVDGPREIVVKADVVGAPAHDIEAGGPWLGIQFGPVPRPLAAHLGLDEGKGQMVLNIVADSPADRAGLQQYDVITAIDGSDAASDMGTFLDQIREFEPNDVSTFSLMRGGARTQATVTIGTRPDDTASTAYKYEQELMDRVAHGNVFRRGGIMRKDGSGSWVLDPLKDDDDAIWHALPDFDDKQIDVLLKKIPFGLQRDISIQSSRGGSLKIETGDDGQITVTKETKKGDEVETSTATYATEEEFEQADPEAFAKYKGHFGIFFGDGQGGTLRSLSPSGGGCFLFPDDADVDFDFDFEVLDSDLDGLQERLQGLFDKTRMKVLDEDLHDEIKARIEEAFERSEDLGKRLHLFKTDDGIAPLGGSFVFAKAATTRIAVGPDGKVTVTVRDGEDELVQTFDSAEQLRTARPDLHAKYEKLLDALNKAPAAEDD